MIENENLRSLRIYAIWFCNVKVFIPTLCYKLNTLIINDKYLAILKCQWVFKHLGQ